ncbi:hypothetical protein BaRGS_00020372 [Batillaria attramentaria]|uniref:Uncharacterized protein n=1 Tax=Batillaria attramentaria TaxID=370345 RepID=A0ABD0KNC3_9CAEN
MWKSASLQGGCDSGRDVSRSLKVETVARDILATVAGFYRYCHLPTSLPDSVHVLCLWRAVYYTQTRTRNDNKLAGAGDTDTAPRIPPIDVYLFIQVNLIGWFEE